MIDFEIVDDIDESIATPVARRMPTTNVAEFPLARFLGFIAKLKVMTKDFGLVPFQLLGTQRYILDEVCKGLSEGVTTFVFLKARQIGCSTFFIALDLFWAFEHKGLSGAFATHTDQSKEQFRNIVNVFFNNLPKNFKIGYEKHNRSMLILKNGSMFVYLVAGVKEKSTSSMGRSGASNFLHATEVAFWGSEEDLKELRATMSAHYPHRLQIYETTANGFNHFEEMWQSAKLSKMQRAVFVGWWRNELYSFSAKDPRFDLYMPDDKLTPLERRRCKQVKEQYGEEISLGQIAWYRWKLDDEVDGDQMKMDEMFPWVEDDAFVATGSKFFTNESLTDAMRGARNKAFMPFRYAFGDTWADLGVITLQSATRSELRIWEEAQPGGHYAIGCDPAFGSSDSADRTVIHVARCFADRMVQVAEFTSPTVSTFRCAWVLAHLAGYYGGASGAMVNLEITGPGQTVFDELQRLRVDIMRDPPSGDNTLRSVLGSMKHYLFRRPDSVTGGGLAYQWKSTPERKTSMMNAFKDSFELRRHILVSMPLLEEMQSIVYDNGQISAEGRRKDDRVIAAALAHEAWVRWIKPKLYNYGITYEKSYNAQLDQKSDQVQRIALDYLRNAKIMVQK